MSEMEYTISKPTEEILLGEDEARPLASSNVPPARTAAAPAVMNNILTANQALSRRVDGIEKSAQPKKRRSKGSSNDLKCKHPKPSTSTACEQSDDGSDEEGNNSSIDVMDLTSKLLRGEQ